MSKSLLSAPRWVGQEDAGGCAPATFAMLSGRTYAEAKTLMDGLWDKPKDWTDSGGGNEMDLDRCLYSDGFYIQRRYSSWRDNGTIARLAFPDPFAPLHYCMVRQPSNNYHFVVMLQDGQVLDPMREGHYELSDWQEVTQVVGVINPSTLVFEAQVQIRLRQPQERISAPGISTPGFSWQP